MMNQLIKNEFEMLENNGVKFLDINIMVGNYTSIDVENYSNSDISRCMVMKINDIEKFIANLDHEHFYGMKILILENKGIPTFNISDEFCEKLYENLKNANLELELVKYRLL